MKRMKVAVVATTAACLIAAGASAASADPTPLTNDLVAVGSDTTQISVNTVSNGYLSGGVWAAGYNATALNRIASWDAFNPNTGAKGDLITLRVNTAPIARPDGSGAGKNLLHTTATNNTAVNFARSSSALSAGEATDGLVAFPFARDEVAAGVKGGSSYAPAGLTAAQLIGIYNGTYTNWSQLGGADATITALLPQSGSGTRNFFLDQLKAANGGVDVSIAPSVIQTVQEHDASVFTTYSNAVVPFSVGRAGLVPGQVKFANVGAGAFDAQRAVYNVVRGADANATWVQSLFGPTGEFCSLSRTDSIAAGGLAQLASTDFGGACGVQVTVAGAAPSTLLTTAEVLG